MGYGPKAGPLKDHPNFKVPDLPVREITTRELIQYTLDYVANMISPPKIDGEDEERSCNSVAEEIRGCANDIIKSLMER